MATTRGSVSACVVLAGALLIAGAANAVSPADKCEAAKNKIAGKYAFCRQKAEAKAVKTGDPVDYSKCDEKYAPKWGQAESTAGVGVCPSEGDAAAIQSFIAQHTNDVAVLLSGGTLPVCGNGVVEGSEQCDGVNLGGATCSTVAGNTAGTLACTPACQYDVSGCAGASVGCGNGVVEAGEDCDVGDLNGGDCTTESFAGGILACATGCTYDTSGCWVARFMDNGDGTVTDNQTGLTWEQKDDTGGIHDKDDLYNWSGGSGTAPDGPAFTTFLGTLNKHTSADGTAISGCFAGHCDWRLPTIAELQTILLAPYPCGTNPCIDPIFGPTPPSTPIYWSATTVTGYSFRAWGVRFSDGTLYSFFDKTTFVHFVRAVRGGS